MASKLFLTLTDKPFRCESCGRRFTYDPHLTDDGYWLCNLCGKEVLEQANQAFGYCSSLRMSNLMIFPVT